MAEQLHKGWLNTRENEKFAPATLATQIYNEDGTSFYRTVSNYIEAQEALSDAVENLTSVGVADLRADLNTEIDARSTKDQELESRLQYFNGSADNALYIIDKNANVIAYVDESGVNSTDFTIPTSGIRLSNIAAHVNDLQGSVESILTKLAYFDGAADNAFYIVDNNKNVIAYIDESGVHSTNFFTTETDFNSLVARINAIETTDLSVINAAIKRLQDTDAALSGSIETLTDRLSYFNGDADDTFYIIDKNQNVIACIKEGGVYSVDFIPNEGRTHKALDEAFDSHIEQYIEDKSAQAGIDKRQDDSITALSESVEKLSAYFNTDPDDTFYIVDKDKNVIAYIREGGVYSTNFTLKDGRNLVTLYDDYERILADAETYNTFNTIETWIEGAIETLKSHTQSLKDLGDSIEDIVEAVGLSSDEVNYPGYETKPANLYEAVIENRTDINILNGEVTQEGSVAKAIDDLHKEILDGASADYQTLKKVETAIAGAKGRLDIAEGEIDAIQGLIGENADTTDETILGKININAQNIASNDEDIEELQTNTKYFNGAADDTLYIVDQTENHNVIALVNHEGVKSVDFVSKTAGSFNAAAAKLDNLQQFVEDFNAAVSVPETPEYDDGIDTLYEQVIKNKDDIAVISGDEETPGSIKKAISDLHNDLVDGASADYQTLKKIETAIEAAKERLDIAEGDIDDIQELIGEVTDTTDATLLGKININANSIASNDEDISKLQQNTQYFNGSADDALYIVDQTEDHNVVAVVNGQGVKSIDFTTPDAGLNATAASLVALTGIVEEFNSEVGIPEEPDYDDPTGSLYKQVVKNKDDIAVIMGTEDGSIEHAVASLKTELLGDATTYKTFGRVEDEIGLNYTAGENTVKGKIQTNAHNITATNNVIGEYPTTTGFPASKTVFQLIENNYNEIAILTAGSTTPGSVAYQIAQVVAGADSDFDTLKEIADWIIAHPEDVAAMWTQINKNKENIEAIFGEIGEKTIDAGQTIHQRIDDNDADIDKLEEKIQYFDGNGDDTFYIVDNTADHNVIAYVNKTGIHAINFTSHTGFNSETGTASELENFNHLVSRVEQAEGGLDALEQVVETHIGLAATDEEVDAIRSNLQGQIDDINNEIGETTSENATDLWGAINLLEKWRDGTDNGKAQISQNKQSISDLAKTVEDHIKIAATDKELEDAQKDLQDQIDDLGDELGDSTVADRVVWTAIEALESWRDGDDNGKKQIGQNEKSISDLTKVVEEHIKIAATDNEVKGVKDNLQGQIDGINTELGDPTTTGRTVWPAIEKIESWAGNLNASDSVTDRLDIVEDKASDILDVIGEKTDSTPGTLWSNIEDINRVFDNDSDDTIYVVDKDKNVVAYFNQNGLTTTNVIMSNTTLNHSIRGLGYNEETVATITLNFDI